MKKSYPSTVLRIKKDTEITVTEQVPYSKPTTEALGWLAGGPANKSLAKAREEYLPGNWFKGSKQLTKIWKMNDVWNIINRVNKNVINMVYSSCLITSGNIYTATGITSCRDRYLTATTM